MLELPPEEMRRLGYRAIDRLVEHLEGLDDLPPIRLPGPGDLAFAGEPCPDEPSDPTEALDALFDEVLAFGMQSTHPRMFARIGSPSTYVGALAQLASTGVNAFSASWLSGSGATAVELTVLDWMRGWLGLPAGAEGILVSGGSLGNLTALAAAAADRRPDRARATAYVSDQTHATVERAWRVLGFDPGSPPRPAGRRAPTPARSGCACGGRCRPRARARAVRAGCDGRHDQHRARSTRSPSWPTSPRRRRCGCTSTGPTARSASWPRPAGVPSRGSIAPIRSTLDPHKWLFQPYEVGAVLVRRPGAARVGVLARRRVPARPPGRRRAAAESRPRAEPERARRADLALAPGLRPRRVPRGGRPRDRARRARRVVPARAPGLGGGLAGPARRSSASAPRKGTSTRSSRAP